MNAPNLSPHATVVGFQEKLWKASVVSQTKIVYNEKELLQLIHKHLQDQGLHQAASVLQHEADLPNVPASRVPSTPTSLGSFVSDFRCLI